MRTLSLVLAVFFCAPAHAQMRKNSHCEDAAKLQPPGRPPARAKKFDKIIPIPEGADSDRYRIEPQPDGLLIIFDRAKQGTTEASE
ncbi:MAG: hypothetical protein FD189_1887 [Elusimicrobia bacterium]|nr:MAG: hypothetical protein FD154_382 [Elusimicrobiota bacterium]KAF0154455.1 MAG: hypothetical protein FD189_1887 [Elusimicrobiota bacterium]